MKLKVQHNEERHDFTLKPSSTLQPWRRRATFFLKWNPQAFTFIEMSKYFLIRQYHPSHNININLSDRLVSPDLPKTLAMAVLIDSPKRKQYSPSSKIDITFSGQRSSTFSKSGLSMPLLLLVTRSS